MEKAIEALIIQMQKNQKETSSVLEALVMKVSDSKDIEPAIDALIVQNKKNNKEISKTLKSIEKKEGPKLDLEPIKKAVTAESKAIQSSIGELKKKYNERIKELEKTGKSNAAAIEGLKSGFKAKDNTDEIDALRAEFTKDINAIYDGSKDVDKLWKTISDLQSTVEEVKKAVSKTLTKQELKDKLKELDDKLKKLVESEVDQRYKPITTGVSSEVKLTGNTLLVNGTEVDLSSLSSEGTGITWVEATTSVTLEPNYGYRVNSGSLVSLTFPTDASAGDMYRVAGLGTGGWQIRTITGQTLYSAEYGDTTGVSNALLASDQHTSVTILCHDSNTFTVIDNHGVAAPVSISVTYEFQDAVDYQFQDATDYDFVV